ncbi:MAG TPA: hypothetical protein P5287_02280 [bacterium]|nr:hypothetical protein [bacterium]
MFKKFLLGLSVVVMCGMISAATSAAEPATQAEVTAFLANPASWLAGFNTSTPAGEAALSTAVQNLALTANADVLNAFTSLLGSANPAAQSAIGGGLGNAAIALNTTNPSFASQISQAVAASGSTQASSGFAAATGGMGFGDGGGGGGLGGPSNSFGGFGGGSGSGGSGSDNVGGPFNGGNALGNGGGGTGQTGSGRDTNPSNNAYVDPNAASTAEEQSKGNISPINP